MFTREESFQIVKTLKLTFETMFNTILIYQESENKNLLSCIPDLIKTDFEFYEIFEPIIRNNLYNDEDLKYDFEMIINKINFINDHI